MKIFKKTVCFYMAFILLLSFVNNITVSAISSFNEDVVEIDTIITPARFNQLLNVKNHKKKFPALFSTDGQHFFSGTINTRGSSSFMIASESPSKRYPLNICINNPSSNYNTNIDLSASYTLLRLITEYTALKLFEHIDYPAPKTFPCFLFFNDVDYGLYLGIEDIGDEFLNRFFGSNSSVDGNLYKILGPLTDATSFSIDFKSNYLGNISFIQGNGNHKTITSFINALESGTDYTQFLNVDMIIKFFAALACSGGTDSLFDAYYNSYIYEKEGILTFIPWDLSCAYECFSNNASILPESQYTSKLFDTIMSDPKNLKSYFKYVSYIRETFLDPQILLPKISSLVSQLKGYYIRDRSTLYDQQIVLSFLYDSNILFDGNIELIFSEFYKQLGEQLSGTSDRFYVPDNLIPDLFHIYEETDLYSSNDETVLNDIKQNYRKAYNDNLTLNKEYDPVLLTLLLAFLSILLFVLLLYRIPKGKTRKPQ